LHPAEQDATVGRSSFDEVSLADLSSTESLSAGQLAALKRRSRLGLGLKTIYGSGNLVDGMQSAILGSFLFFYLTAVCGLSGSLAGVSSFLALTIDAVADPLIGSLSDNSGSPWGRRHPFMIAAAVPLVVMLGLLFSIPSHLTGWPLFGYITLMTVGLRIAISLFNVPYVAMGAELSDDYAERSSIVVFRILFAVVATVAASGLGFGVFLKGSGGLINRAAYIPFGWTCGVIMLIGAVFATLGTLGARDRLHQVVRNREPAMRRLALEVVEVFRNPSFRTLFLAATIFFVAQGVGGTVGLHANKYFWKLPTWVIQWLGYATAAGLVVGLPISWVMGRTLEKRTAVMIGLGVISVSQFLPAPLQILGLLPPAPMLYWILIGNTVLAYAMITCSLVAFQSMAADAADEHEHLYGARREGLFFAGLSFAAKAAAGGGTLIAGICLDLVGFPSDVAAHGGEHIVIAPHTLIGLGVIHGPVAAVGTLIAASLLIGYHLDKKAHAQLLEELGRRRVEVG
jgi:GPH family glycoside/pentoside/hexuronide:cation symporter